MGAQAWPSWSILSTPWAVSRYFQKTNLCHWGGLSVIHMIPSCRADRIKKPPPISLQTKNSVNLQNFWAALKRNVLNMLLAIISLREQMTSCQRQNICGSREKKWNEKNMLCFSSIRNSIRPQHIVQELQFQPGHRSVFWRWTVSWIGKIHSSQAFFPHTIGNNR